MNSIELLSMSSLKSFIIQESLKAEHAERFLSYQERYHHEVFLDLKRDLEKKWKKDSSSLNAKFKIAPDDIEFALLQNPNSTIKAEVDSTSEKITNSRHREPILTSMSMKISLLFSREERDLGIKKALESAIQSFKKITDDWSEIFKIEQKGKIVPCFKIVKDHDEVRLQFALSSGIDEMYKTIYSVRVEYGKSNSKLKDFDRIYLVSLL